MKPFKVGEQVRVVRGRGHVEHSWFATIVKITKTRAYLSDKYWVALDDESLTVRPRYIDYTTFLERS